MESSASSSAKKRNRAKNRQKRKEKEQQQVGSGYSTPDEDIPPNEPYGPWDEPKRQWDTRLSGQMPSVIDVITTADPVFLKSLRVFIAGDDSRSRAIDISDAGVDKLVKACPSLQVIALRGTHNLTRAAFPNILKSCKEIESVIINVVKGNTSKRTRLNSTLDWLTDKSSFVPKLRYLEFRGLYISSGGGRVRFLEFLTKCRPALEIVFEYDDGNDGLQALIRDMSRTPLSRVPGTGEYKKGGHSNGEAEEAEEDWKDQFDFGYDIDEDLISNDFEMDDDYADYDDFYDSDEEGIDPQQMRKLLAAMEAMKGGSGDYY
ncbi:hypothetical protein A1F97_08468 [Pyrenophora tritici-repentis]|nr:hypothetical protein A1F97_08468 [Pyrenophora tritici-repentis]